MDYQELIDQHMLIAMDKQLHAADVLGDRGFAADLDRGVLAFGDDLETRAELVGSEAPGPGTWLWAWANPAGYGDHVLEGARRVQAFGEEHGIRELTEAEIPLDEVSGTRQIVATVGITGAPAYYSAEVGGGTRAYMLIDHESLAMPPAEVPRLVTLIGQTAGLGEIRDWRVGLRSYAAARGLELAEEGDVLEFSVPGSGNARVQLDGLGRVGAIKAVAG